MIFIIISKHEATCLLCLNCSGFDDVFVWLDNHEYVRKAYFYVSNHKNIMDTGAGFGCHVPTNRPHAGPERSLREEGEVQMTPAKTLLPRLVAACLVCVFVAFGATSAVHAANPCNPCAANPCAANPCAANPCAANPCAANPCAANPCAANPCAANPCAANPCAPKTQ